MSEILYTLHFFGLFPVKTAADIHSDNENNDFFSTIAKDDVEKFRIDAIVI